MKCREVGRHLPGYLDGAVSAKQRAGVREHLETCKGCRADLERYRRLSVALAGVPPMVPPEDLAMRIRIEASRLPVREMDLRPWLGRARVFFENVLKPLAVPATGGLLTAALVFVFAVQSMVVGMPIGPIPNDLPTDLIQPAQLESLAPFPIPNLVASDDYSQAGILLIEATLNAQGEVVNYSILAGPNNPEVRRQVDQVLIFSRFRPELNFGRPTAGGRVLLSFGEVRVHG